MVTAEVIASKAKVDTSFFASNGFLLSLGFDVKSENDAH
jgi:hypothetical protein